MVLRRFEYGSAHSGSVVAHITNGSVSSLTVSGFTDTFTTSNIPLLHIAHPTSGVQATAKLTLNGSGNVNGYQITRVGSGYTTAPEVMVIQGYTEAVNEAIEQSIGKVMCTTLDAEDGSVKFITSQEITNNYRITTQELTVNGGIVNADLDSRFENVASQINNNESRIEDLETFYGEQSAWNTNADSAFLEIQNQLNILDQNGSNYDEQLNEHETRIASLETFKTEQETANTGFTQSIYEANVRIDNFMADNETILQDHQNRIVSLEEASENYNNSINDHLNRIANIESDLGNAFDFTEEGQFRVKEQAIFNTDVNCMNGLAVQNADLFVVDGTVVIQNRDVLIELDTLADGFQFKADKTTTDNHETRITDAESSITTLGSNIDLLTISYNDLTFNYNNLQTSQAQQDTRLTSLETTDTSILSRIDGIQKQSNDYGTWTDVANQLFLKTETGKDCYLGMYKPAPAGSANIQDITFYIDFSVKPDNSCNTAYYFYTDDATKQDKVFHQSWHRFSNNMEIGSFHPDNTCIIKSRNFTIGNLIYSNQTAFEYLFGTGQKGTLFEGNVLFHSAYNDPDGTKKHVAYSFDVVGPLTLLNRDNLAQKTISCNVNGEIEIDGVIKLHPDNFDSVPTDGSHKLMTSQGIRTAIVNAINGIPPDDNSMLQPLITASTDLTIKDLDAESVIADSFHIGEDYQIRSKSYITFDTACINAGGFVQTFQFPTPLSYNPVFLPIANCYNVSTNENNGYFPLSVRLTYSNNTITHASVYSAGTNTNACQVCIAVEYLP